MCPMRVAEAEDGERPRRGTALVAPGDLHMVIEATGVEMRVSLRSGPPVHYQRPAVDVLFHSVARLRGVPIVACLLTGMGADGADGMVALLARAPRRSLRMSTRPSCSGCHARRSREAARACRADSHDAERDCGLLRAAERSRPCGVTRAC